ncbi:MAG: hypothetical protein HY815_18325 [Candidatus Riflebacteria bacterium]|nr:hypothetical protein [Candidatus Riflebacteria bacterium]
MPWSSGMLGQVISLVMIFGLSASLRSCTPGNYPGQRLAEGESVPDAVTPAATVPVSGQFLYQRVAIRGDPDGTILPRSYETLPVRCMDVIALDSGTRQEIQAAAVGTDESGRFTIMVPEGRSFTVALRSTTRASSQRVNLEVRDTISSNLYLYEVADAATAGPISLPAGTVSVSVGSVTIPWSPSTQRQSAVPSMLDACLNASDTVKAATGTVLPLLTIFWNVGSTRGSYFGKTDGPQGGPAITVLGGDSDNDETHDFDDAIAHHEYGHFVCFALSKDCSLGGTHTAGRAIYPSAAYSEGIAQFLSAVVPKNPTVVRSVGITGPSPSAWVKFLEGGRGSTAQRGIRVELSVGEVLWDLVDGAGGLPNLDGESVALSLSSLFDVLISLRGSDLYLSFEDFLTALTASAVIDITTLQALLLSPEDQTISFPASGIDVWPTTVSPGETWADVCQTRFSSASDDYTAADASNRFFQFVVTQQTRVTVTMTLQGGVPGTNSTGTNIDMFLCRSDNTLAKDTAGNYMTHWLRPEGPVETASGVVSPGRYIVFICGRPDLYGHSLTNASSRNVSYRLQVTSP